MNKVAVITGISGQDGAYLAELLLNNDYKVIGLVRSLNNTIFKGLQYLNIKERVHLVECDLTDISQIVKILVEYRPAEVYNLAAQSSVSLSFQQPIGTFHFNTISVFNFLEAIRIVDSKIKFYQASSSEMYGRVTDLPITDHTELHPVSPYAISKAAAHWTCVNYRESYGMFVCCGVLFNHESFLRADGFFVKKVIVESIRVQAGLQDKLIVGNIDIKRDFGYAPKYVEAMYLMMQQASPQNYLICSGTSVSLRSIIEYVFNKLSIDSKRLEVSPALYRPSDIPDIYGNNKKSRCELKWNYDLHFFNVLDKLIEEELTNGEHAR